MDHLIEPDYLPRGVHAAPWHGPTGEMILLAVTADATLAVPPETVPLRGDVLKTARDLWHILDVMDPPTRSSVRRLRSVSG